MVTRWPSFTKLVVQRVLDNRIAVLIKGVINMKSLIFIGLLSLTGCASTQKAEIPKVPEFDVHAMTRSEVVTAINECQSYGMKPFVEYLAQKTEYGKVLVPVNVHCNPSRRN
jgi:hypothetical protein